MSQTARNTIRIPELNDGQVLSLFDELVAAFPPSEFDVALPEFGLGRFNNSSAFVAAHGSAWKDSHIIAHATARLLGEAISVVFQRQVAAFEQGTQKLAASMWENEFYVVVRRSPNPPSAEQLAAVWQKLDQFKRKLVPDAGAVSSAPADVRVVLTHQISQVADLHVTLLRDAEAARTSLDARFMEKEAEFDRQIAQRVRSFEEEVHERRTRLAEAEEALASRKSALDDRDHMHVRRDLRAHITSLMQQRMSAPTVSKATSKLRDSIIWFSILGIGALVAVAAFGAWDTHLLINRSQIDAWILTYSTLRFVAPLAVATGLLIYLLNWLRRIHAEDVRAERDLERYRYDIDRASWAVETILEAQSETGTRVPAEWVKGATQGLFTRSDSHDYDEAREALAALLGFSAQARVGSNGLEVGLNRQGLSRLSREAGETN